MEGKCGHWNASWDFDPEQWVGFVYRITHIPTGRAYIGKKLFTSTTRKIVKGRKNRKRCVKPSNWKSYTGSSNWLNAEIASHGKEQFRFDILSLHESRGTLAYTEVERLVMSNALRAKLPDGDKAFFNGMISPIKFTPPDETECEKGHRVTTS